VTVEISDTGEGEGIIAWSWRSTLALTAALALGVIDPDSLGLIGVGVAVVMFAIGTVLFLWSYAIAVQRSRTDDISVAGLYLLSEGAPKRVKRTLLGSLGTQTVVVIAAASARPFTVLAFGLLAPMFGMGMIGMWSARHGHFRPRPPTPPRRRTGNLAERTRSDLAGVQQSVRTAKEKLMLDEATETRVIGASPERCFEIAVDVENYGQWTADLKDAEVLERDEAGRPALVEFRAAAMGRSTTYALRYDHSETPSRLSWVQETGDITKRLDGWYRFEAVDGEPDQCEVIYHLEVELVVPLPGFVKRRAEGRIIHTALDDLQRQAES